MKLFSLLTWVTQFGLSVLLPVCLFLMLGNWLQETFAWGIWITILCGVLGVLTSIRTAGLCFRSLKKDADAVGSDEDKPPAFNEHD